MMTGIKPVIIDRSNIIVGRVPNVPRRLELRHFFEDQSGAVDARCYLISA
jgi:hypothetical protein